MNEPINRNIEKSTWKRWVYILIFGSAVAIMFFLFVHESAIYIYKQHHYLRFDIGRGLFWEFYFWMFAVVVVLANFIYLLSGKANFKTRLIINAVGWLLLFSLSVHAIQSIPYAVMLPNIIALCDLTVPPIILKLTSDVYRHRDQH